MLASCDLVFLHSSDELYGADRMLLELVSAVPDELSVEVWLPTDLPHVDAPLCAVLTERGTTVRHLDLPIMRRAYRGPRGLAGLLTRQLSLVRELRRRRPRTVYCTTSASLLAAPVARAVGIGKVIGHIQEIWSESDRRVLSPFAAACHTLLAISTSAAAPLPARLRDRTVVVPNATPPPEETVLLAERTGVLRYVVASRWNGWKGHRTLLAAWERVPHAGHLVVLGGPPASGDAVDVAELVARLSRPDTVTLVGEVVDPAPFLVAADVAIVPSDEPEPFGLVAIEAFARGRPVVGSAAGGMLDIITPQHDGWLFPPGDVEALAQVLSGLTREAVNEAGSRALQTYERRYTRTAFAARWRKAVQFD